MNPKEVEETIVRYNKRFDQFGYSQKALGWEKERSNLRFHILTSMWNFKNTSILDFGCGFGDLYQFVQAGKKNANILYTGIDINENLIAIGKQKFSQAEFIAGDILKINFKKKFDFVLSSGVFNFKLKNNIQFIKNSFSKFNEISSKGFAVNFLSDKVDYKLEHTYHANPSEILDLAYKYSNNVILRNDYMPFEFTIFVQKDIEIDENKTVYATFLDKI